MAVDFDGLNLLGWLFPLVIVVLVIAFLLGSVFVIVPAGHRGVLLELGAPKTVLAEGFHFLVPFYQSAVLLEVRTLKYEVQASAATADLLDVDSTIAVNYHLSPEGVLGVYQLIGKDYQDRVIAPALQETFKATTAKFDAEKLITTRASVKAEVEQALRERLLDRSIIIESVNIIDFKFPEQFNEAITSKQTAVQLKLKAQNDLERIKVEALQAVATAQGIADASVAKAKGDAETIRIINEQLQRSPEYINLLAVQRWNGVLPYATSGVPFLQLPIK